MDPVLKSFAPPTPHQLGMNNKGKDLQNEHFVNG